MKPSCECEDSFFRDVENFLRKTILQYTYFPGDMMVTPYLPVRKAIHFTGIGVEVEEETLATDKASGIVSHKYKNQFQSLEDVKSFIMK